MVYTTQKSCEMKQIAHLLLLLAICVGCTPEQAFEEKLIIEEKVDQLGSLAREPMLAEHPNGDLYVTGYKNTTESPQLWKSTDSGKTWTTVDVGSKDQGADGNSDVDLVIDEEGNIYFLTMRYTTVPADTTGFDWSSMKGEHIAVGISQDEGSSWEWTYLSQNDYDDRPWIEIASDGSAHVIWNDGKGVHYVSSNDLGKTWSQRRAISSKGGSSHLAAGPNGKIAVRVSPSSASGFVFDEGLDLLILSMDYGSTWNEVELPGERDWSSVFGQGTPRWVEPIEWDEKGNLYYLWSEGKQLNLSVSYNDGKDWKTFPLTHSQKLIYYPYLNVANGEISCTWISGNGNELTHHAGIAIIQGEQAYLSELEPLTLTDIKMRRGGDDLGDGGEYFPIMQLSNGDYGMVTTIQNYSDNRLGFTWWKLSKTK